MKHNLLLVHLLALLTIVVLLTDVLPTHASPAAFTVDSMLDEPALVAGVCASTPSGKCTLRAAIQAANATPGADTILLPAGNYTLTIAPTGMDDAASGDLNITDDLTITGDGQDVTTVDGGGLDRVFNISGTINVILSGLTIRNGNAGSSFGGGVFNGGSLVISGTTLYSNTANSGAGIFNNGSLTIVSGTFTSNLASFIGGAVRNNAGIVVVSGSAFIGNATGNDGGGIDNTGLLTVMHSMFLSNTAMAGNGGGGVYNRSLSSVALISSSTFLSNTANNGGGGIRNFGALTISGTLFANNTTTNTSQSMGGAIRGTGAGSSLSIVNSTFTANFASNSGGAIFSSGSMTLTHSPFVSNRSNARGGAIATNVGTATVIGGIFTANSISAGVGGNNGGAIFVQSPVTVIDSTFSGNSADNGGAVINDQGMLSVATSTFYSNVALYQGGALFSNGTTVVNSTTVYSNTAQRGGAIRNMQFGIGAGTFALLNSTVTTNTVSTTGGAIFNTASLTITNSTLSGNRSASSFSGGAIHNATITGSVSILNSTIVSNTSDSNGGSIRMESGLGAVKNSIVAFGTPNSCSGAITSLGHNIDSGNSCQLNATADMVNTNPLLGPLQDNGGPTLTHALLPGSPAINHGDNLGCPPTDQRGLARPQAGICDIGAYEYGFPNALFLPEIVR